MASDMIYREDAKDFVRYANHKGLNPVEYIDEIPAADVVEVVRCRDCIHAGDSDCPINWPKNGEDYCSFGERMTDNE